MRDLVYYWYGYCCMVQDYTVAASHIGQYGHLSPGVHCFLIRKLFVHL